MQREILTLSPLALNTATGTTAEIQYKKAAGGMIHIPTGSSITSLTWHTSHDGTTYVAAQDSEGAAVTQTVAAAKSYPIPDALYGAPYLKAVSNASGNVHVTLKA